jgi:predicted nucleotidyltransferase
MVTEGTSDGVTARGEGGLPSAVLRDIVAHFRPLEVILFGSAGRGERGVDGNLDIAVILPDDAPARVLHWRAVNEARRGHAIAVDIVPFRRSAFVAATDEVGSLPWVIAREGRVVWQREAAKAY